MRTDPAEEQPYFIGSGDVAKLLDVAHWLIRLRLGNELLILNGADVAALMTQSDEDFSRLVAKMPQWLLFFNLAAYDYLPQMRMEGQIEDTRELLQRLGSQPSQGFGGVGAGQFLEAVRRPSEEPYWKFRRRGGCQDIFFLTTYAKFPGLVKAMSEAAEAAGYPSKRDGHLPAAHRPGKQLPLRVQPVLRSRGRDRDSYRQRSGHERDPAARWLPAPSSPDLSGKRPERS